MLRKEQENTATIEDITKYKKYPSQDQIYNNPYLTSKGSKKFNRAYKEVGYGIPTPITAIDNSYVDKKCPFTSDITVRGAIIKGEVVSLKQQKTAVVLKKYLHYHPKYMRYERRHTRFNVHISPCWEGIISVGDKVICGETRPLSKTKHFAIIGHEKSSSSEFKQFTP